MSSLPMSGRISVDMAIIRKRRLEAQDRTFKKLRWSKSNMDRFQVGDWVHIQDPKSKTWREKGVISEVITHENASRPSSYLVVEETGSQLLQNVQNLRLRTEQPGSDSGPAASPTGVSKGDKKVKFSEEIGSAKKQEGDKSKSGDKDGAFSFERRRSP